MRTGLAERDARCTSVGPLLLALGRDLTASCRPLPLTMAALPGVLIIAAMLVTKPQQDDGVSPAVEVPRRDEAP